LPVSGRLRPRLLSRGRVEPWFGSACVRETRMRQPFAHWRHSPVYVAGTRPHLDGRGRRRRRRLYMRIGGPSSLAIGHGRGRLRRQPLERLYGSHVSHPVNHSHDDDNSVASLQAKNGSRRPGRPRSRRHYRDQPSLLFNSIKSDFGDLDPNLNIRDGDVKVK